LFYTTKLLFCFSNQRYLSMK